MAVKCIEMRVRGSIVDVNFVDGSNIKEASVDREAGDRKLSWKTRFKRGDASVGDG